MKGIQCLAFHALGGIGLPTGKKSLVCRARCKQQHEMPLLPLMLLLLPLQRLSPALMVAGFCCPTSRNLSGIMQCKPVTACAHKHVSNGLASC